MILRIAATLVILALVIPSGLSFQPSARTTAFTTHLHSAIAPKWAMPSSYEQDIRNMLDEAVMLCENCLRQGSSTDEAESIVCEIGRVLYTNLQGEGMHSMVHKPKMLDQLILSESQLRLQKLKLSITDDGSDSSFQPVASDEDTQPTTTNAEFAIAKEDPSVVVHTEPTPENTPLALAVESMVEKLQNEEETELMQISLENDDSSINDEKESSSDIIENESFGDYPDMKTDNDEQSDDSNEVDEVDIAIVGAGIGGLCAGAILNTVYGKKVGIYESHYLPGGCAHAFERVASNNVTFTFDSGPTIVLGCSKKPYNPLRQVLDAIGQPVEWIPYAGWGMIENPGKENELRWKVELGSDLFQEGPIKQFGSDKTLEEFEELRKVTQGLVSGAIAIPAMAMRSGKSALIPLLRYLPALVDIIKQGEELTQGTFKPYMDGPIFTVTDPWLRSWLDALAFSLSGLPASRTAAAAMAYVLYDMHRPDAALDYPRGGLGQVIDALVRGVEQGDNGSKVHLRSHVESIDTPGEGGRISGLTLRGGKKVKAKDGVICNAPVWSLNKLIKNPEAREVLNNFIPQRTERKPRQSWVKEGGVSFIPPERESVADIEDSLLYKCDTSEMTGSFLHLHIAIRSNGLNLDKMEAHYTVMDRSLAGDGSKDDGPCGELNMIAVSNPCVIDKSLAPEGYMVVHAYGAGNEPYGIWKDIKRGSAEYRELKEKRCEVLWRAVESIIPDVRERVVLDMVGSPITHERFLRRPMGTYGSATEDYLKDGSTPYDTLMLAGDGIFPGIGVPAVALSGASAANAMVSPFQQWKALDKLKSKRLI